MGLGFREFRIFGCGAQSKVSGFCSVFITGLSGGNVVTVLSLRAFFWGFRGQGLPKMGSDARCNRKGP